MKDKEVIVIKEIKPRRRIITARFDPSSIALFHDEHEYKRFPDLESDDISRTLNNQQIARDLGYTPERKLTRTFNKARMFELVRETIPENLKFPVTLFKPSEKEGLIKHVKQLVDKKSRVGLITCYRSNGKHTGKSPWEMGMDDPKILAFLLSPDDDPVTIQQEYDALRKEFPHFHMSSPGRLDTWLKDPELETVAVVDNPPGHGSNSENHFVLGLWLTAPSSGDSPVEGELTLGAFHTRAIEKKRGCRSIYKFQISNGESEPKATINQDQIDLTRNALLEVKATAGVNDIYQVPFERIEELCRPDQLRHRYSAILSQIAKNMGAYRSALATLQAYGLATLDLIGKFNDKGEIEYMLVLEAKGPHL